MYEIKYRVSLTVSDGSSVISYSIHFLFFQRRFSDDDTVSVPLFSW